MLPSIDFTQQLSQIQAQLASLNATPQQPVKDPTACEFRLPCGLCSKTNSFCGMQTTNEAKTDE